MRNARLHSWWAVCASWLFAGRQGLHVTLGSSPATLPLQPAIWDECQLTASFLSTLHRSMYNKSPSAMAHLSRTPTSCSAVRVTTLTSATAHSEESASPRNPNVASSCGWLAGNSSRWPSRAGKTAQGGEGLAAEAKRGQLLWMEVRGGRGAGV